MAERFPRLYLIRHGATEWSVTGQHTGRSDIALTEFGEKEARNLKQRLEARRPEVLKVQNVFASPLQRATKTAELLGLSNAQLEPDLQEWNYGQYEGLRTPEIRVQRPGWSVYHDGAPGGENLTQVEQRANTVIQRVRSLDGDAMLIAHGHLLCVLAGCWLKLGGMGGELFQLGTASLSILTYHHSLDRPVVELWNEREAV